MSARTGARGQPGEAPGAPAALALEARELVVQYPGAPAPALAGVDLAVARGSLCAVLGPNGSGKSTLMRALLGLVRPLAGQVRVGGRPVAAWERRALAREVGAVSQHETVTFPVTVRELVAMGRYPHLGPLAAESQADREAVSRAMARSDTSHLEARPVATLSGGELQRVRIARALAQEPRTLALDEPTAGLDVGHEMGILELLRSAADGGLAVLLITHHLDLAARFADRLLLLDGGRVVAEGPPQQVMRPEVLSAVYRWPLAVEPDPHTGTPRVTPLGRS